MELKLPEGRFKQIEGATLTIKEEDVPCGKCFTGQWHDAAGVLVRQDVHVMVDPDKTGFVLAGSLNYGG